MFGKKKVELTADYADETFYLTQWCNAKTVTEYNAMYNISTPHIERSDAYVVVLRTKTSKRLGYCLNDNKLARTDWFMTALGHFFSVEHVVGYLPTVCLREKDSVVERLEYYTNGGVVTQDGWDFLAPLIEEY